MAKIHQPRHGSMQFWPRVKAKRQYAQVRSWTTKSKDPLLGFMGYKVGMTHVLGIDTGKNSATKGEEVFVPVTVIECPPMKVAGLRLYKKAYKGTAAAKDILFKVDKELARKIVVPKAHHETSEMDKLNAHEYVDARLLVYTQPKLAGLSKKKPEIFEVGLTGSVADKIAFAKSHHDKELPINTFFKEGELVDIHAVTTGKGLQGPVKRFGVAFKNHKTEKGVRRVGTLGGWSGQGHFLYRVAHPGQMGYHLRTEYNKQLLKIGTKPEDVNPKAGFPHYGLVKSTYVLVKGSVAGPQKRAILFAKQMRVQKVAGSLPTITEINRNTK
ncbi:MAG TPA: 50S ribosomal protein L3 [Alphaproteobacteria bacterium]|nr:50S ribosomal protein L3 [Alphaproteobacteria bacterium]